MKRVLFLVNHDVVIYNFRRELVERLLREGFEVVISSPYGERIEDLVAMGCKYVEVAIERHGTNIFKDLKLILYYKKIIKNIMPDVVLSYTIKPNIYGGLACRLLDIPYIANITGLGTAVEHSGIIQKIIIQLYKFSFKKIRCIFFQNRDDMNFFLNKRISANKHVLIPGSGVNLEYFQVLEYPSEDTIDFIFISRIMREKGIEEYLEAAEYIKNKYSHTRFHVCGFCEQDYEKRLALLHEKKIIIYHGMLRDIRFILNVTHCTIHPTYYPEGMSNVLLESSACGRPIITTNRSGCKEVVDIGLNGYIVEEQNVQDLIEKIELFLAINHNEKRKMGLSGRKKVEKEFDRNIVVDAYMSEIIKI